MPKTQGVTSDLFGSKKRNWNHTQNIGKTKKTHAKRERFKRVNSEGQKTILQPKRGDRVVKIPYTNALLCISKKDVICTVGLACQLSSLITTFILTIFALRISGKIVTVYELFQGYYCLEVALIINSVVDPIVCVIFSKKFRNAFESMIMSSIITVRRK